jgi:hypothetical protein
MHVSDENGMLERPILIIRPEENMLSKLTSFFIYKETPQEELRKQRKRPFY